MRGLFAYNLDVKEIELKADLVDTYRSSPSKKNWNFCLKKDIQWSDGEPLQIQHVIDSWQRLLNPEIGSPHAHQLFNIVGAKAFYQNKLAFSQVGIRKINDRCFSIDLIHSDANFPHRLTAPYLYPIRKDLINIHKEKWTLPKNWVGLGAYKLNQGDLSTHLLLRKNKKAKKIKSGPEEVKLFWLDSAKTALNLFQSGQLDLIKSPQAPLLTPALRQESQVSSPSMGLTFIGFNETKTIDREVKTQLQALVATASFTEKIFKDRPRTRTLIPWEKFDLNPKSQKNHQTAEIKKLNPTRKLVLSTPSADLDILQRIAYLSKKKLNLNIEIKIENSSQYFFNLLNNNNFDLYRLSYTPAILLPSIYLEMFASNAHNNFSGYKNKKYSKKLAKLKRSPQAFSQRKLLQTLENKLLYEDIVILPLYRNREAFLLDKKKWQWEPHPSGRIRFERFTH